MDTSLCKCTKPKKHTKINTASCLFMQRNNVRSMQNVNARTQQESTVNVLSTFMLQPYFLMRHKVLLLKFLGNALWILGLKFYHFSCRLSQGLSLFPLPRCRVAECWWQILLAAWFVSYLVANNLFDKEALLNNHIYDFIWAQRPDLFGLYSRYL